MLSNDRILLILPAVLFAISAGLAFAASVPPVPDIQVARDFLHNHTDLDCDPRGNPNLQRADRVVVMAQFEDMKTVVYDLYCDNSGPQTTRIFLKWKTFDQRYELMHFAQPVYDILYENEGKRVALARPVAIEAYAVSTAVENAVLNSANATITSRIPWGLQGDAGVEAVWQWNYAAARFDLVSYVIDPFHETDLDPPGGSEWKGKAVRLFPSQ